MEGETLYSRIRQLAEEKPSDVYLVVKDRLVTYSQLLDGIHRRSSDLQALANNGQDPIVGVVANDSVSTVELIWAGLMSGVNLALFDAQESEDTIVSELSKTSSQPLLYIVDDMGKGEIRDLTTDPRAQKPWSDNGVRQSDAPGFFLRTSGTEGESKWVLCHYSKVAHAIEGMEKTGCLVHASEKHAMITPSLAHSYGLSSLLEYSISKSSIRLPSTRSALGPMMELSRTDPTPVSAIEGVPYFYEQFTRMARRFDLSAIQHIGFGGGAVPIAVKDWVISKLPNVSVTIRYGLTETPSVVSQNLIKSPSDDDWEHSGKPLPIYDIKIVEGISELSSTAGSGEIYLRGETVSASSDQDNQGGYWFKTGDIGAIDELGRLHVTGRKSAFIKRRGYRLSPEDIEKQINEHSQVLESMVWQEGELLYARVVPADDGLCLIELSRNLANVIPNYAVPDKFELGNTVPRTKSGKIKR